MESGKGFGSDFGGETEEGEEGWVGAPHVRRAEEEEDDAREGEGGGETRRSPILHREREGERERSDGPGRFPRESDGGGGQVGCGDAAVHSDAIVSF